MAVKRNLHLLCVCVCVSERERERERQVEVYVHMTPTIKETKILELYLCDKTPIYVCISHASNKRLSIEAVYVTDTLRSSNKPQIQHREVQRMCC